MIPPNVYPVQIAPLKRVELGPDLRIIPFHRAAFGDPDFKVYRDMVKLEGFQDDAMVRLWLLFHAFVLGDSLPLRFYDHDRYAAESEMLDEPSSYAEDYDNVVPLIYLSVEGLPSIPSVSYGELFQRFSALDLDSLDQVRTCLLDFTPIGTNGNRVCDGTYWSLAASYSVIEYVLGSQKASCNCPYRCPICGKYPPKHRPLSEAKWIQKGLDEIMGDSPFKKDYGNVILKVRDRIRHRTVHNAAHPKARDPQLAVGTTEYHVERVLKDFEGDAHALFVLNRQLHEIARRLLLDEIFELGLYPRLTRHSVQVLEPFSLTDADFEDDDLADG